METIYTLAQFRWGHEKSPGTRIIPPTEDDLVAVIDPEGNPVLDGNGEPMITPKEDWQPVVENVELQTVILVTGEETGSPIVFKFAFDKESLARFLEFYVQYLDADGRQIVREELSKTSDIVVPSQKLSKAALKLVE